jgi:hypothetical protein
MTYKERNMLTRTGDVQIIQNYVVFSYSVDSLPPFQTLRGRHL